MILLRTERELLAQYTMKQKSANAGLPTNYALMVETIDEMAAALRADETKGPVKP